MTDYIWHLMGRQDETEKSKNPRPSFMGVYPDSLTACSEVSKLNEMFYYSSLTFFIILSLSLCFVTEVG